MNNVSGFTAKRIGQVVLSILILIGLLAACRPEEEAATIGNEVDVDVAQEKIELRVAWFGSPNRHERVGTAIELFESLHPHIDVVYESAQWSEYWELMDGYVASNNLPDVMEQDYATLKEWVNLELVIALDQYEQNGALNFADVSEGEIVGGRINGTLYAVNLGTNSQAFVLDKDVFEQAGIPLPNHDWTWQEFEQIATQLHESTGKWGIGNGLANDQMWKSLYMGHGQWAYNDEGTGLGYDDDSILTSYLEMLVRLKDAGVIPSREEELERFAAYGVEAQPIVTGEAAMGYFWSNKIGAMQAAAGEERNFMMTHLPRPTDGVSSNYIKPSQFFSITSHAKHPNEAAMFIDFITNNIEANQTLAAEFGVPISSAVRAALFPTMGKAQKEMFAYMERVAEDSSPIRPPDPAAHSDVLRNVYYPEVIDPVFYGQLDPAEAAQKLREEAEPILSGGE